MSSMNEIPLRAYGVAVVVIGEGDDERRFLLLRRTRPPAGAWTHIAGAIESGEKAYETAVREVREEHGDYRWCTVAEGVALLTFPGAGKILEAVDSHFVIHEPSPHLGMAF